MAQALPSIFHPIYPPLWPIDLPALFPIPLLAAGARPSTLFFLHLFSLSLPLIFYSLYSNGRLLILRADPKPLLCRSDPYLCSRFAKRKSLSEMPVRHLRLATYNSSHDSPLPPPQKA